MNSSHFLEPLLGNSLVVAHFIGRIPDVEVTEDRAETLKNLEPFHRAEVERLGLRWKNLRQAEQVHGNRVALVGDVGSNYPVEGVDGLICSGVSDAVLAIYVADCAAVWLFDTETRCKALVHSGKKGTEGNIVSNAIDGMKKFYKADPSSIIALLSPCIRPPHYEMDIPGTIIAQLKAAGVPAAQIFDSGLDTGSNLDEFYSYRIEKGKTGRMMALFARSLNAAAQ